MNKIFAECQCNVEGSTSISCDESSGKCDCKDFVVGDKCNQCDDKHFDSKLTQTRLQQREMKKILAVITDVCSTVCKFTIQGVEPC